MRIEPAALATALGALDEVDLDQGLGASVLQLLAMTKNLLDADGVGLMLVDAAAGECDGEQQQPALRLLSEVYQLTAFDLTKHGEGQLALLAADRGMLAAQQAADPLAAAGWPGSSLPRS
jgi:hypothetical protein